MGSLVSLRHELDFRLRLFLLLSLIRFAFLELSGCLMNESSYELAAVTDLYMKY